MSTHVSKPTGRGKTREPRAATSNDVHTSEGLVAIRAYELFCARGCTDGQDVDDWLEAERQLREPVAGDSLPARG